MATKKIAGKTLESAPQKPEASVKPLAKKAAKKATPKIAKKAATKAAAALEPTERPQAAAVKKAAVKKITVKPSLDAIARAAYLNYRRRVEQSLPGNPHSDWLEAERQLAELD
jgi:hypothetical protein